MHEQILPLPLLILSVAVLLAESMVEAVRLDVCVLEIKNIARQFDTE